MKNNPLTEFVNLFDRDLHITENEKDKIHLATGLPIYGYLKFLLSPESKSKYTRNIFPHESSLKSIFVKYFSPFPSLHFVVMHGITEKVLIRKFSDEMEAMEFYIEMDIQSKNYFMNLIEQRA